MASIKFIVSQARTIFQYRTTRIKVLKCCANIYYNKQCLKKKIVPRYADIKLLNISPFARNIQKKVHSMRIRMKYDSYTRKKAIELIALNCVNYKLLCMT